MVVFLGRDQPLAGTTALLNMVLQAKVHPPLPHHLGGQSIATRTQLKNPMNQIDYRVSHRYIGVGTIIVSFALLLSRGEDAWKRLARDHNAWVGLVILEQYIVLRQVGLDQIVLQDQSLGLGVDYEVL